MRELLFVTAWQSALVFLAIALAFRLAPRIPAQAKAWIWRLAFLKPLIGLLPFAAISLNLLPAPRQELPLAASSKPISLSAAQALVAAEAPEPAPSFDPLLILWIGGSVAVAAYGTRDYLRALRLVRQAVTVDNPDLQEALAELTQAAGLRRPARLVTSTAVQGPMLVGVWRPTIVLPDSANDPKQISDVELMLAHEVAHIVRRDLVWFGATWIVQSLFFFNPAVWLAARWSRLDHESATDRYACGLADVPSRTYGEMLLRATVVARQPLAVGILPMAESYRSIHQRLEAMTHFNQKNSRLRNVTIAAIAFATVGTLPLYQLAQAAPQNLGRLLFTAPQGPKNPIKYSVYQQGPNLWVQLERDGRMRRFLWDPAAAAESDPKLNWMKASEGIAGSVDCKYVDYDVRMALQDVFKYGGGKSYMIDPRVQGNITASMKNVRFEAALSNILHQVYAEYHFENGIYKVVPMSQPHP